MLSGHRLPISVRRVAFTLFPAVDVAGGLAVRLAQGKGNAPTEPNDALLAALDWQSSGAAWIHLVDLDAAFDRGSNAELLASIIERLDIKVQLSGGITDERSLVAALATDCERVVLSTAALEEVERSEQLIIEHGERIAVALDVRLVDHVDGEADYRLSPRGASVHWTSTSGNLLETIDRLDQAGCRRYIVTDVSKDGMLGGPNVDLYRFVTEATNASVIASGGVSAIDDLVQLAECQQGDNRLEGAIVGKALYAGRFTLAEALDAVDQIEVSNQVDKADRGN